MDRRRLSFIGALTVAVAGAVLTLAPVLAQTPAPAKSAAKSSTIPRTADGNPDLQGTWTNATLTPVERPPGHGLVLTKQQVEAFESRIRQVTEEKDSDPNRPVPPVGGEFRPVPPGEPTFLESVVGPAGGSVGGYNFFWLDPGVHVAVINGEPRSSIVVDPPNGRIPPLTPEARQRVTERFALAKKFGEFDHPEVRSLAERCLTSFGSNAGPPMLPNYFYNNNYQIVQTKDHVMIVTEMVHDVRIIRLNGERLPKQVRPWFGDSIGHWEGDTLVVETTNFHPLQLRNTLYPVPVFQGGSENLKVTERITLAGPDTVHYKFTVEDPTTFTAPWSGELPFNRSGELIYEYACHEGNYALSNVLSGERDRERRTAEKKKQ